MSAKKGSGTYDGTRTITKPLPRAELAPVSARSAEELAEEQEKLKRQTLDRCPVCCGVGGLPRNMVALAEDVLREMEERTR